MEAASRAVDMLSFLSAGQPRDKNAAGWSVCGFVFSLFMSCFERLSHRQLICEVEAGSAALLQAAAVCSIRAAPV